MKTEGQAPHCKLSRNGTVETQADAEGEGEATPPGERGGEGRGGGRGGSVIESRGAANSREITAVRGTYRK